jgi:hypothetical protein
MNIGRHHFLPGNEGELERQLSCRVHGIFLTARAWITPGTAATVCVFPPAIGVDRLTALIRRSPSCA